MELGAPSLSEVTPVLNDLREWIGGHVARVRGDFASGRRDLIELRYLLFALVIGVALGCVLSFLSAVFAVLIFILAGAAIGYAARSFVSHRRRLRFMRERE